MRSADAHGCRVAPGSSGGGNAVAWGFLGCASEVTKPEISTGQQSKFNEGQQCQVSLFFAPLINRTVIARPCASLGANKKRNSGLITRAMSSKF